MMKRLLLSALLGLAACGGPQTPATVTTADAWCRPTPNGARAGACYLTLTASADDRLVGAATSRAGEIQIHEMTTDNGVMKMGEMTDGLPLSQGEAVALEPGGVHLMLIGLTGPLVAGETVPLTLRFDKAPEVVVQAAVRQATGGHAGH
ncbi:copper chaperone PCu(A)C [Brevundimonas sp. PAMC22021]|uniref:copper chaperone PCu(A)C n=1 Tax=Brevundimonas sp. PAMC22021 TaxID=2861285 RepID=UPI001C6383B4|nr:copper chaperone PCu(A)C [Brevundimonas sp. PAMC22021]QYF87674.1 copper chaperone PCu(A)C [Brevundimonas sp. PAMC22021]